MHPQPIANDPPTVSQPATTGEQTDKARALTWRSAIIGLGGVALLCAITPYNDFHLHQTYLYGNHFPLGCLFLFTVLVVVVNQALRRIRRSFALRQQELLVVWAMLVCGSGLASSGLMRYLGPVPLAPFYFAEANGWTAWASHIPAWMVPSTDGGSSVIKWFFEGLPQSESIPWGPWVHVFLWWGLLFAMLVGLSVCICTIARRQWVDRERLTFPLVHIPIEMSRDPEKGTLNSFLRNRLMWLGCLLTVTIHGLNGLHSYYFSIPSVPLQWEFPNAFPNLPWSALGFGGLDVFLSVIGIMFLVPTEVSFSVWFFFVAFRLLRVARAAFGMEGLEGAVPNHEAALSIGGFAAWGVWMLWAARAHLASIWRGTTGASGNGADAVEPIPLRYAVLGAMVCFLGVVLWTSAAGAGPALSLMLWSGVVLILLVLTRIVAESGLLFVQTPFVPTDAISAFPGMRAFDASNLGPAMMTQTVFISDPRESLMPSLMNSLRLKGNRGGRDLLVGILLAVAVGYGVSFVSFVATSYRYGGLNLDNWANVRAPKLYYDQIAVYAQSTKGLRPEVLLNVGIGGALTALMLFLRGSLVWWPLHPLGFLLAGTYAMSRIWFSVMVAWALKSVIVRYGGLRMFRVILPFFLGMVLGEALIGGFWVIVGMITGVGTPCFLPS